jgi:hypothetical protein
VTALRPEVAQ